MRALILSIFFGFLLVKIYTYANIEVGNKAGDQIAEKKSETSNILSLTYDLINA